MLLSKIKNWKSWCSFNPEYRGEYISILHEFIKKNIFEFNVKCYMWCNVIQADQCITFCIAIVGIDPPVIHIHYVHSFVVHKVSLMSIPLKT